METAKPENMLSFRAPLARGATALDRSFFSKTLKLAAATVHDNRNISKYRKQLAKSKDLLEVGRLDTCRPDPVAKGKKCLLLRPEVKAEAPTTWSSLLQEAVQAKDLSIVSCDVKLNYDYWSYLDIMSSILPEDMIEGIPVGFNRAGHVAHLNLREQYLPYKKIIAQVILDKNPTVRTVINKTDDVGTESKYRTFTYEVLAGPDDLNVELKENDCTFKFDYSKVYWNSKLETEHSRLIRLFRPGEVVCDVMAGIGPFAIPAGKKGVFVFANDMNPESYRCLEGAIKTNKVSQYVRPFNQDGLDFIQQSARLVYEASKRGEGAVIQPKISRTEAKTKGAPPARHIPLPATVSHYVMNLPASALEFLHRFRGIYHGLEHLFEPSGADGPTAAGKKLPLVHVHCFAGKNDDNDEPLKEIRQRILNQIGVELSMVEAREDPGPGEVIIYDVRDVAPNKRMFCATFRLPPEMAFAPPFTPTTS